MKQAAKLFIILFIGFILNMPVSGAQFYDYDGYYTSECYDFLKVNHIEKKKYNLKISFFRLMALDDVLGKVKRGAIYFKTKDMAGNNLEGKFERDKKNKNEYIMTFTKGDWEYIKEGSVFNFEKIETKSLNSY